jgi:hypothetical protein
MQKAVAIAQFLRKLAVAVPDAIKVVKLAVHFPAFRMDLTTAIIKLSCMKFWHWHGSQIHFSASTIMVLVVTSISSPNVSFLS